MSEARRALEQKARNAILQEAFFRTRSAILWAGVLVLMAFLPAYWWAVLLLGVVLWGLNGVETMRNPTKNAQAVAHIFQQEFKPARLNSKDLSQKTVRALEYLQQIEEAVNRTREGVLRDRLRRTADEVIDWVEGIHHLAKRIDSYRQDEIIARDMNTVPQTLIALKRRLAQEDDAGVKDQIRQTINDRQRQLDNLEKLDNTIDKAELQLERTLSALGTVYSQLLLIDGRGDSTRQASKLQEEISEQVHQLQDLTEAMDEYYYN
jgi:hypothetical protein